MKAWRMRRTRGESTRLRLRVAAVWVVGVVDLGFAAADALAVGLWACGFSAGEFCGLLAGAESWEAAAAGGFSGCCECAD